MVAVVIPERRHELPSLGLSASPDVNSINPVMGRANTSPCSTKLGITNMVLIQALKVYRLVNLNDAY